MLTTIILSASSGSYNPNVSRVPGTYTQFGIWTIDTFDVYSVEKISNSIFCDITACGAPTACSVSATLAEGNLSLSWSGASDGAGNAITSYEIQYSDSTDNSTWGAWTALTTVATTATSSILSVSPSTTRGNYRRFRVRTRGAAGESFYSDWTVSGNTVRRNTPPTPPSSFTAAPVIYEPATVTLTWSGAIPEPAPLSSMSFNAQLQRTGLTGQHMNSDNRRFKCRLLTYTANASNRRNVYPLPHQRNRHIRCSFCLCSQRLGKEEQPADRSVIVCPVSGSSVTMLQSFHDYNGY